MFDSLSVPAVYFSSQREVKGGLSILQVGVLGAERGGCGCRGGGRLEVHITTGAGLFGSGRGAAPRGVPVHASTLTTRHFPTVGREDGETMGGGRTGGQGEGRGTAGKEKRQRDRTGECEEAKRL